MRLLAVVLALGAVAACTKRNPEVCCSTPVECDHFGFDDITPCEGFQVCVEGACESPTCTTSVDCADPVPYCVDSVCVATCSGDESCVGAAGGGAHCALDGACVECLDGSQCTAPDSVCDATTRTCRGCVEDAECGSGICLAAEGVCADAADAVHVAMDGTDGGECTEGTPCETVAYGLTKVTGARRVLRIASIDFHELDGIVIARDVYIDGVNTRLQRDGTSGPVVRVIGNANVTIEGIRLVQAPAPSFVVTGGSHVVAHDVTLDNATMAVDEGGSELTFSRGLVTSGSVGCASLASLEVRDSVFDGGAVASDFCTTTIVRNRIRASTAGPAVAVNQNFPTLIENNVIEADAAFQGDFMMLYANLGPADSSAIVRFNTLININPAATSTLITCSGPAAPVFSGNLVIAYSPNLFNVGSTCVVDHTLFDDASGAPPGTANLTAPAASIVTDLAAGDYRPAAASAARGAADPTQALDEDISGTPRPLPAGSVNDVGAFEVE